MLKPNQHLGIAIIAFLVLLLLGSSNKLEVKKSIRWTERSLHWTDFPILKSINDDYEAQVYSSIYNEGNIQNKDFTIFASMDPNFSGRIEQDTTTLETNQLLIHEQYHFNITEYCARLLRKEILTIEKDKLTKSKIEKLTNKYNRKLEELQYKYDTESDHNLNYEKQRYWELKIDDLLRNTAYYFDENLFNYQDFTKDTTNWYRHAELTFKAELLVSYPESNAHRKFGDVYKIEKHKDSTVIKFYRNGKNQSDPFFNTEKLVYLVKDSLLKEIHLYNNDGTYNDSKGYCIKRYESFPNGNIELTYFDKNKKQVHDNDGIFKITRIWDAKNKTLLSTYRNKKGEKVKLPDGPYYELRELDSLGRTVKINYYDFDKKPVLNDDFISAYQYELNDQHKVTQIKLFDTNGEFAFYKDEFHSSYKFDSRGNLILIENLDEKGEKSTNSEGIFSYEYTYDHFGNLTDTRKFNDRGIPVLGNDDYHQQVTIYDSLGRLNFKGKYYPEYVLSFSDDNWGATSYEYENDSIINMRNLDVFNIHENNSKGVGIIKQYFNNKKQIIQEDYLDANGTWAKTEDLINTYRYKYNKHGNQIELSTFDSLQRPHAHTEDVAKTLWEFDQAGNKTKTIYYNEKGELANALDNITYNKYQYNSNNSLIGRSNYDKKMMPQEINGAFRIEIIPNRFKKDSIVIEYDRNNKLINGVNKTVYNYNKYGNIKMIQYFNKWNQPTNDSTGVHKFIYTYNKEQINTGYKNYGITGQPVNDNLGVWKEEKELTRIGFLEKSSYYNTKNEPVIGAEGYHKIEYFWNESEEISRISTYGTDQKLINDISGIADYVYIRNKASISTRISFYDEDSNLTEDSDGVAEYLYTPSLNGLYYIDKKLDKNGVEISEESEENL